MDRMLTLMQIAALLVAGMCHALLGSVKVPLARKLKIDEARVGGLVSVFGFTLIPMVLAAGFLVDWLGKQAVLSGGFVLLIVSLAILARLETYRMALLAILVLGTGWSALVNVLNVTSPPAFLPFEDIPRRMAYAMNMGDFIFGMGAFLTPILVAILIRKLQLVRTFLVLSSLAIVPLLLGLGVHWEHLVSQSTETVSGGLSILLSDPVVWLCCLAFFCHVPIEASVATWATTLMTDKGVSEAGASTLLSVFWLTFMGSRLMTALTLPEGADTLLVLTMAALCIAFTVGIAFSRTAWLTCAMVVVAGLVLGPIFPTLIAILLSHVEPSLHGRTVGLFFCIGGIGWTAIPLLIGSCARRTSVQRAFLIATACATILTALLSGGWFYLSTPSKKSSKAEVGLPADAIERVSLIRRQRRCHSGTALTAERKFADSAFRPSPDCNAEGTGSGAGSERPFPLPSRRGYNRGHERRTEETHHPDSILWRCAFRIPARSKKTRPGAPCLRLHTRATKDTDCAARPIVADRNAVCGRGPIHAA